MFGKKAMVIFLASFLILVGSFGFAVAKDVCGDGQVGENEFCDEGNLTGVPCVPEYNEGSCEYCSADCSQILLVEDGPRCGDEFVQEEFGEVCDDGNTNDGDTCSADCLVELCTSDADCVDFGDEQCTFGTCNLQTGECEAVFFDDEGPETSELMLTKVVNQCKFSINAVATDECSAIEEAEYFLTGCPDVEVRGTPLDASDGIYNDLIEEISKSEVDGQDGEIPVYVRARDLVGNWGACEVVSISLDCLPPKYPTCEIGNQNPNSNAPAGIIVVEQCNANEHLVCGDNPLLEANVCDDEGQSDIQLAEYFLDDMPLINWQGIEMDASDGAYDESCEDVESVIDLSELEEGTHYVQLHAKDTQETWGKFSNNPVASFIKDTTAPKTFKEIEFADGVSVECEISEANGKEITNGCYYVKQGTEITLNAFDFNPDNNENGGYNNLSGEYAGDVVINYRIWFSEDCTVENPVWQAGEVVSGMPNEPVSFTLDEDSCHLIEYWAVDGMCGNEEAHHFELDIVDTKAPVTTKRVSEPNVQWNGDLINYFITSDTEITLSCEDQLPHPVGDVELNWKIYYNGESENCDLTDEEWSLIDSGTSDGYEVITGLESSCHKIVYSCTDGLGNEEVEQFEVDAVDNEAPEINVSVVGPIYCPEVGNDCYIDGVTEIHVSAEDVGLHPVGGVMCSWGYYWSAYPGQFFGPFYEDSEFIISGLNESQHEIIIECWDALNNTAEFEETYIVDKTAPETIKEIGTPQFSCFDWCEFTCGYDEGESCISSCLEQNECEYVEEFGEYFPLWINDETLIELNSYDQEPHPSGVQSLNWRVTLVDDSACESVDVCQGLSGSGEWNSLAQTYASFNIGEESCHLIEYHSVDNVNKIESVNKQCVFVDMSSPETGKEVGEPKLACEGGEEMCGLEGEWPSYYLTSETNITLSCADVEPHPVEKTSLCFRVLQNGEVVDYSEHYSGYYAGEEGFYCVNTDSEGEFVFNFYEDSLHNLEWYCEDALGNSGEIQSEWDNVDNMPPQIYFVNPTPDFAENVEQCIQSIVVMAVDEKSGVDDSSLRAELVNSSGDVVREVALEKFVIENTVTYQALMDKELPAGEYELVVYAKDNLGNEGSVSRTEILSESVFAFVSENSCSELDVEEGGECELKFNVCMRGGNGIKFWMDKSFQGTVSPELMNAMIKSENDSAPVGLMEVLGGIGQEECEAAPEEFVWDGEKCWFISDTGELPLSCEEINGKTQFELSLNLSSEVTSALGTGVHSTKYWLESFLDEESPLCGDDGGNDEGHVVINELMIAPSDILESEWIEIYNPTDSAIDLTNWTIHDNIGIRATLSGTLSAGEYLVIDDFSNDLNNGGDIVMLKDSFGNVVDKMAYGAYDDGDVLDNAPIPMWTLDESLARIPNGVDTGVDVSDFVRDSTPTIGTENIL